jgi:hypothetical protein
MPQKKKQNKKEKKTNKKPHRKQVLKKIVQQSIPYFASEQNSGHQYNKDHTQFVQQQQQQTRTDSLVGDLVSKLISKIENSGTQQTQQYSNEVQPITNDNSNTNSGQTSGNTQTITNNIYPNSGQSTTSTDTPDPKKTAIETAAGTALSVATGYSPEVTGGIAAGSAVGVGLIGGIIAGRKKIGQAFKNTFSGKKTGGTATSSRLLKEDEKAASSRLLKEDGNAVSSSIVKEDGKHVRGKDQNYMELPSEVPSQPTSRQTSFDEPRSLTKQSSKIKTIPEEITPLEEAGGTGMKTPMSVKNRIKQELGQIYGENTLSRAASNTSNRSSKPTNLDKQFVNVATVTPARTEPATSLSPQTLSLEAMNRPNILQNVLKKLYKTKEGQEKVQSIGRTIPLRNEFIKQREAAIKLQSIGRTVPLRNKFIKEREAASKIKATIKRRLNPEKAPQPARLSGVHETSRQGATTTRTFDMNQAIEQRMTQAAGKPQKRTKSEMSEASTVPPPTPVRKYFNSDNPEYRRGQSKREKDEKESRVRPLIEMLNPNNPFNQGYFGDALKKDLEGYHPREVKQGRPKTSYSTRDQKSK